MSKLNLFIEEKQLKRIYNKELRRYKEKLHKYNILFIYEVTRVSGAGMLVGRMIEILYNANENKFGVVYKGLDMLVVWFDDNLPERDTIYTEDRILSIARKYFNETEEITT